MQRPSEGSAGRRDLVAFFAALCLLFSTLEFLIPKPFPFLRLGLANLPVLIALSLFPLRDILLLVALKIIGQGMIYGTLFSYVFLFSTVSSVASAATMIIAQRSFGRRISLIGISVLGALFSNLAQLILARWLVFGEGAWLIGPPFLAVGTASGLVLGWFAQKFYDTSLWLKRIRVDFEKPER